MAEREDSPEKKALLALIKKAKDKRSLAQDYINECYDFGLLDDRNMVNAEKTVGENRENDLFDTTFADAIGDFATARQDEFTPDYRKWVKATVNESVAGSDTELIELQDLLKEHEKELYKLINTTSYYEACEPAWEDCAISVGAVAIPYAPASKRLKVFPVFMSDLLIVTDHVGDISGIWFEKKMTAKYIKAEMPDKVDMIKEVIPTFGNDDKTTYPVIQGDHRDMDFTGYRMISDLIVGGKVIEMRPQEAGVPPMIIPLRWGMAQNSGWTYGPCKRALPSARLLDELGYNNLVHLSYASRMPLSYENDGQQNYEKGIEPGGSYPRQRGSNAPTPIIPGTKADDYFDKEILKESVQKPCMLTSLSKKGKPRQQRHNG